MIEVIDSLIDAAALMLAAYFALVICIAGVIDILEWILGRPISASDPNPPESPQ